LHQVNFQFEPAGGSRKDSRVHNKQGSRRVGGKVIMQRNKRVEHKENNYTLSNKADKEQLNNDS
jgi:hypothetical protein